MGVFVYILKNNNMNTGSVLFFVFTLLSIVCGQCTYTASNGCTYDLSGLTIAVNQPTSAFYTGMDTSNSTFYFNICGALNSGLSTGFSTPPGVLQETLNTGNYSCGAYNNTSIGDYSGAAAEGSCPGVNLIYFDGTACINAGLTRQTTINIGCDSTVLNGLSVGSIVEPTTCAYEIQVFSNAACGVPAASPSASPSASGAANQTWASPSASAVMANQTSASPSATISVNATISVSVNATAIVSPAGNGTATATATPESDGGIPSWVWWVIGSVAIVIIIIAIAAAGFFVYKKKQHKDYDSIGYE